MTALDLVAAVAPVADAPDALGVPYYLAGSVISSLHGVARATADVDVVAALRPIHATALTDRLAEAYYADADVIADAIRRRAMFNVIRVRLFYVGCDESNSDHLTSLSRGRVGGSGLG